MLPQLVARLVVLGELGLGHLGLDRSLATLSAGEWRRVRLANALGCELVEALYVLDEPTAGLHPSDTGRLIALLERLRDAGNTVVVVEHDDEVVSHADWVVDLGPGAGTDGGRVMYSGPPDGLIPETGSITAKWRAQPPLRVGDRREPADWIQVRNARGRNLRHLDVRFPLGVLCVVTGVGGAGKSSLVGEVLYRAWRDRLAGRFTPLRPSCRREPAAATRSKGESLCGGYVGLTPLPPRSPVAPTSPRTSASTTRFANCWRRPPQPSPDSSPPEHSASIPPKGGAVPFARGRASSVSIFNFCPMWRSLFRLRRREIQARGS